MKINIINLKSSTLKGLISTSFIIWYITLILFFAYSILNNYSKSIGNRLSNALSVDVLIGIGTFLLGGILTLLKIIKEFLDNKKKIKHISFSGLYLAIIILLSVPIIAYAGTIIIEKKTNHELQKTISPASVAKPSPLPKPTINSDPIVACQFKYISVRQMKSSECKRSTECQLVQGGEWFFYPSVEECKVAQEAYWTSQKGQEASQAQAKVECIIGGRSYFYSSWDLCYKARAVFDRFTAGLPQPGDISGPIINQFNRDAAKIVGETEEYQVNPNIANEAALKMQKEVTKLENFNISNPSASPKPKCPPTYISGNVIVGGELPCEP